MKLSLVSLSCAKLLLNARPASVSEDLVFDANFSSTGEDSDCQGSPAASDRVNRCKQPGHYIWDQLLCDDCGTFWTDTHPWCKIACCDPGAAVTHDHCECTHQGQKYVIDTNQGHIVGKNTAQKCCGGDMHGRPKIHHADHEACGCGDLGTNTLFGGKDSDCCSGRRENWKCVARICAKKGESGKCCRVAGDHTPPDDLPHSESCGCFHAGDFPNINDIVDWGNCCSGKANAENNGCACIDDTNVELSAGTEATDCCSGQKTDDGNHCKAATCTEVGAKLGTNGDHCCSGTKNDDDVCTCVPSGQAPSGDGFTFLDCCSHKMGADGKCAFLFKGDSVPSHTSAGSVCNSGRKDSEERCRCVNKGAESDNETDCCSGSYLNADTHGKMCGCVATNEALTHGAPQGACCTKTAVEGHCTCGVPGSPVLGMMNRERDCCAKDTESDAKFCGCVGPDAVHNLTYEESEYCCGGSAHYNGQACTCVSNGQAVGGWAHRQACCSGHIVAKDDARVCASIAGVYEVSYRGEKREGWLLTLECDDTFEKTGDAGASVEDHLHYDGVGHHCSSPDGPHSSHATFWIPYGTAGKFECLHVHENGVIGDHYDIPLVNGVPTPTYWGEVHYTLKEAKRC